ncbi:MAG: lysostaphin resistance A-like protein, partial [Halobacteriaceae archaeon]
YIFVLFLFLTTGVVVIFARLSQSYIERRDQISLSTNLLLLNIIISHGVFALIVLALLLYSHISLLHLGITIQHLSFSYLIMGLSLGVGLAIFNELASMLIVKFELDYQSDLRELLTPRGPFGWIFLIFIVLPLVAGFEELLFRVALIGAVSVVLQISPWIMLLVSSVLFGAAHMGQGKGGRFVATILGIILGISYIFTGSFVVIVVGHYLVNSIEFIVHQRLKLHLEEIHNG